MRLCSVWNLPAVSAMTRSAPRAAADSTASYTTDAGSAPAEPRTRCTEERSAHMASWSAAAARKVSPAASTTPEPASASRLASLPMVVVFPVPLTPTNSHTDGHSPSLRRASDRSKPPIRSRNSVCSAAFAAMGSPPAPPTRVLAASTISELVANPTSALIRASVTSVHASCETDVRSRAVSGPVRAARALERRSRSEGPGPSAAPAARSASRPTTRSAASPTAAAPSTTPGSGGRRRLSTTTAATTSTAANATRPTMISSVIPARPARQWRRRHRRLA